MCELSISYEQKIATRELQLEKLVQELNHKLVERKAARCRGREKTITEETLDPIQIAAQIRNLDGIDADEPFLKKLEACTWE